MKLSGYAKGRPNKSLLAVIAVVLVLLAYSMACQKSAGAPGTPDVASITAPGLSGEGWMKGTWRGESLSNAVNPLNTNPQRATWLCVKLTPNCKTQSDTTYTVDLYENGSLRETSTVSWSASDFKAKPAEYVPFPLTDQEYEAYSVSVGINAHYVAYWLIYKELQDIFSVAVE